MGALAYIPREGDTVRCFFGTEPRDGIVEWVRKPLGVPQAVGVRFGPGWIHTAKPHECIPLPRKVAA